MQAIVDFIVLEWKIIFGGIGVPAVVFLVGRFFKPKPTPDEPNYTITNTNNLTFGDNSKVKLQESKADGGKKDLAYYKDITRILFIDDDKDFKVVKILKDAGWQHTSLIKDVKDLDQKEITESDILFVDIQGVGAALSFADEGLGVALAIKKRNPQKKVVIYSAQAHGERLHTALSMADSLLKKNADPYEFIQLVESFTIDN